MGNDRDRRPSHHRATTATGAPQHTDNNGQRPRQATHTHNDDDNDDDDDDDDDTKRRGGEQVRMGFNFLKRGRMQPNRGSGRAGQGSRPVSGSGRAGQPPGFGIGQGSRPVSGSGRAAARFRAGGLPVAVSDGFSTLVDRHRALWDPFNGQPTFSLSYTITTSFNP